MATSAPLALAGEHLALIERGVSTIVGSASLNLVPSLMRAVGSAVHEGGALLTVYLARSQASQLLRDIAATGRMAVVFSQPSTHRTLQVKTRQVRLREATEADVPLIERYLVAMQAELAVIGFAPAFVQAMLAYRLDDLVALDFTPDEAFDQTPGSHAGQPIGRAP